MRKTFTSLAVASLLICSNNILGQSSDAATTKVLNGMNDIAFVRIGETYPSTNAYVLSSQEQLSGQAFQQDAIISYNGYQYTVYYNHTRNVCIARRKLPVGNWQEVVLPHQNVEDDPHNVISIGICPNDGTIHLSYDHHNTTLHYSRSIIGLANDPENMEWATSSFGADTSEMIAGVVVPDVTYPRFIRKPDGNLLFECRFGLSGDGDSYLREYDGNTHTWSYVGRYVQGMDADPNSCAYINRMDYDVNGRLHVSWCWRDDFGGGSNHDLYYAYSDDHGRTWKDTHGAQVAVTENIAPSWDRTPGASLRTAIKSLEIESIPYNKGYINQESQATDSKGRVHIINSYMEEGTESNWASSRTKAVLHHRFRDTNGTWKHNLVKNNGVNVNSYCRTQIMIDANDNAYVIANGAEIYAATDAKDYTDWNLLDDVDKGRFASEPQIDRRLLMSNGILSFVYLGRDKKVTTIDYLLDNPNATTGTGLYVEYFSDKNFESLIGSNDNVIVGNEYIPSNAKSVRWSGTFETSYGENYKLYLNTSEEASVYIDDKLVLFTKQTAETKEYEFDFSLIASHKHNIRIESKSGSSNPISLSWSSSRVAKTEIPLIALYPTEVNEVPAIEEPTLPIKEELETELQGVKHIVSASDPNIFHLSFEPSQNYSLEIKAQINSVSGRGLDFEARNAYGKGFRVSLDETKLNWTSPLSGPNKIVVSDNTQEQIFRFAVLGSDVYIYQNEEYIGQQKTTDIGNINTDTNTEEYIAPLPITDSGNLIANPTFTGIANNAAPGSPWTSDGLMGADASDQYRPRVQVGSTSVPIEINENRTAFTIRFDYGYATYFSYPITLKPNTWYEHSVDVIAWGSRTNLPVDVVISSSNNGLSGIIFNETMYTPATADTGEKRLFRFKTPDADSPKTYYLTYRNTSGTSLVGITNLVVAEREAINSLLIGKNYKGGNLDANIISITYDEDAYAPSGEIIVPIAPELERKGELPIVLQNEIQINATSGQKSVQTLAFNPSTDYTLEISATVSSATGRGLDFEARDESGLGLRSSLSPTSFQWIAPVTSPIKIETVESEKQIIRYAVEGSNVHIYKNGEYVNSYERKDIGNLDETGLSEITASKNISVYDASNMISNPDFRATANNTAPSGWLSEKTMGGGTQARVQVNNAEIPGSDPARAAFVIRFDNDNNYGTWYSYPVQLEPNTWYEYSFDLIAWGTNTGKTFNVIISSDQTGASGIIAKESVTTPSTRATSERKTIRFKTDGTTRSTNQYYLTFAKLGSIGNAGVTNLTLVDNNINRILFGKNYSEGAANIKVHYITYDDSQAFAPAAKSVSIEEVSPRDNIVLYTSNYNLIIENLRNSSNIDIYDMSGRLIEKHSNQINQFTKRLKSGIYIVKVTDQDESISKKIIIK